MKLFVPIYPSDNVEDWLLEVEKSMKATVRDNIERSIGVYPEVRVVSQTGRSLMSWFHRLAIEVTSDRADEFVIFC